MDRVRNEAVRDGAGIAEAGLERDEGPAVVPLAAAPFDDYSVFIPPAPGDRYGAEVRVKLYDPATPGILPRPDGRRVRVARNGIIAAVTTRYVAASGMPAPLRRAGHLIHD